MNSVIEIVSSVSKKSLNDLDIDTALIGENGILDSLGLVELCLQLEDLAATLNFDFDWTSDSAMSRTNSMFRNIGTLEAEFNRQKNS
ncbi:hypothetical protein [Aurantimicrobium minutum]|uniref:hypothetical protein n=1 Tax=Aurantimicrobium minutum TaxID=708131 RepID=UPI0024733D6B|nr:hypothetical protein [Aurantimicrobium minutum]MDH6255413.1 acyl carrier protein [Aurantimicrobium minutum]